MKSVILKFIFSLFIVFSGSFIHQANAQVFKKVLEKNQRKTPNDARKVKRSKRFENNYPNTSHTRNLPPGQAKKIHGEKSARDFAPGHQKKKNKYYSQESRDKKRKHYAKNKRKK